MIDALFRKLRAEGRKALMPFITAGDPDLDFRRRCCANLSAADAISASWAFPTAIRSPMAP